jgi:GNAT superfamily N-acetyltransferase
MKFTVQCHIYRSFRVQQVAGMFDVPLGETAKEEFNVELPAVDEPWTIGVIVGPSGSGKSTVAKAAFGDAYYVPPSWPIDRAVIDGFPEASIKDLTSLLTSVGFSSPPSWIKPYHVLSGGERFRCDLARALLQVRGRKEDWGLQIADCKLGKDAAFRRVAGDAFSEGRIQVSDASGRLVVFDEFTSVVDRTVAQIGSAAVAKAIRRMNANSSANVKTSQSTRLKGILEQESALELSQSAICDPQSAISNPQSEISRRLRFVAVTCHYDVLPWLEPDWVLDMATGELSRRRLRRPTMRFEVRQCRQAVWKHFARHHYLSGALARAATCYVALWQGEPVAFCATCGMFGRRGRKRVTRIVVLPDYQGLGLGMRLAERVCEHEALEGFRCNLTTSHPAAIAYCQRSPRWQCVGVRRTPGASHQTSHGLSVKTAAGRAVASFEFVPT